MTSSNENIDFDNLKKDDRRRVYQRLRYKKKKLEGGGTYKYRGLKKLSEEIENLEKNIEINKKKSIITKIKEYMAKNNLCYQRIMLEYFENIEPNYDEILDLLSDDNANAFIEILRNKAHDKIINDYNIT
jgi:hypothetical protein